MRGNTWAVGRMEVFTENGSETGLGDPARHSQHQDLPLLISTTFNSEVW